MNEGLMADLLDIYGRLEALHGALGELAEPADVERAAEVIDKIETAAFEAAQIVSDDDGIEEDREECTYGSGVENALGVAILATFHPNSRMTEGLAPEVDTESLIPTILSLLVENFEGYHLASHHVYVYRDEVDENDAYIGIEVPASRLIIEVDEPSS
jgi:hypothetical protein